MMPSVEDFKRWLGACNHMTGCWIKSENERRTEGYAKKEPIYHEHSQGNDVGNQVYP
jgi:hypothetical protein